MTGVPAACWPVTAPVNDNPLVRHESVERTLAVQTRAEGEKGGDGNDRGDLIKK